MAEMIYNPRGSREMSSDLNRAPYHFDRNVTRDPENIITIFTVNTREQFSTSAGAKFAGRPANARYMKVGTINDPKNFVDNIHGEDGNEKRKVTADDGRWVAMDWLNPQNIYSLDQDYIVPGGYEDGTNLLARGLFFIVRPYNPRGGNMNDTPTEEEVAHAETRLRNRYTALVRLYQSTSASSPAKLPEIINDEMVDALDFANMETPYNSVLKPKVTCQNCGEKKLATAKFHKSESLGMICIEPTQEGWKAAVAAGIKTREDVPEEFRWAGRSPNPR